MYYLQSRYYNPTLGRFISSDIYTSTGQGLLGNNMFAYCGNNPVSRADSAGTFFNTVCGAVVGGLLALFTHSDKENPEDAFWRGFTTGAIAGAALDVSIVTAGVGSAIAIAAVGGGIAAAADYAMEQNNKGEDITAAGLVTNATIGAGLNVLFMGAGRTAGREIGNSIVSIGEAIWKNTVDSVTSSAGKLVMSKLGSAIIENTAYSLTQGSFGKLFSIVADGRGVY